MYSSLDPFSSYQSKTFVYIFFLIPFPIDFYILISKLLWYHRIQWNDMQRFFFLSSSYKWNIEVTLKSSVINGMQSIQYMLLCLQNAKSLLSYQITNWNGFIIHFFVGFLYEKPQCRFGKLNAIQILHITWKQECSFFSLSLSLTQNPRKMLMRLKFMDWLDFQQMKSECFFFYFG